MGQLSTALAATGRAAARRRKYKIWQASAQLQRQLRRRRDACAAHAAGGAKLRAQTKRMEGTSSRNRTPPAGRTARFATRNHMFTWPPRGMRRSPRRLFSARGQPRWRAAAAANLGYLFEPSPANQRGEAYLSGGGGRRLSASRPPRRSRTPTCSAGTGARQEREKASESYFHSAGIISGKLFIISESAAAATCDFAGLSAAGGGDKAEALLG